MNFSIVFLAIEIPSGLKWKPMKSNPFSVLPISVLSGCFSICNSSNVSFSTRIALFSFLRVDIRIKMSSRLGNDTRIIYTAWQGWVFLTAIDNLIFDRKRLVAGALVVTSPPSWNLHTLLSKFHPTLFLAILAFKSQKNYNAERNWSILYACFYWKFDISPCWEFH